MVKGFTQAASKSKAPFDVFGLNPTFYVRGSDKTVTWIGCLCSFLLVFCLASVISFYCLAFFKKEESKVTSTLIASKQYPFTDFAKEKQLIMIYSYYGGGPITVAGNAGSPFTFEFQKFFNLAAYIVSVDTKNGTGTTRKKLPIVHCSQIKTDMSDVNHSREDLQTTEHCVEFLSESKIGGNLREGLLMYLEVRLERCETNCAINYLMTNPVPPPAFISNPDYFTAVQQIFSNFALYIRFLDITANVNIYKEPIIREVSSDFELLFDADNETYYRYTFQQLNLDTVDGMIAQGTRTDSAIQFKNQFYSSINRNKDFAETLKVDGVDIAGQHRPFGTILFELTNQVYTITRDYPNMIDLLGNIGGVGQVLTFVFVFMMVSHHDLVMELFLLNEAILQKNAEQEISNVEHAKKAGVTVERTKHNVMVYSYFEIFGFKYCCCNKKSDRYKYYAKHMEIIAERMDIGNIVTNSGNINVLSNVLMEPYQMKIISHFKRNDDDETILAAKLPIDEAMRILQTNLREKNGDEIQQRVDQFLVNLIKEDGDSPESQILNAEPISGTNGTSGTNSQQDLEAEIVQVEPDARDRQEFNRLLSRRQQSVVNPQTAQ